MGVIQCMVVYYNPKDRLLGTDHVISLTYYDGCAVSNGYIRSRKLRERRERESCAK